MSTQQFMRSLNSPWRDLSSSINSVTQVHYPEPTVDIPAVDYSVYERLKKDDPKAASSSRSSWFEMRYRDTKGDAKLKALAKAGVISEPSTAGVFDPAKIDFSKLDRINNDDVITNIGQLYDYAKTLKAAGSSVPEQPTGLWNRVIDVMSRLEYAGATNQHENSKKKLDVFEAAPMGIRALFDPIKEKLTGDRSQEQINYDADVTKRKQMEGDLSSLASKYGKDSGEYVSLKQVYDKWIWDRQMVRGAYHPAVNPNAEIGEWQARPKGEFETVYESDRFKQLKKRSAKGKSVFDLIPSVIPTSGKEFESWKKGWTGKSKRTYIQNYAEDKNYSGGEAAMLGILSSIAMDPLSYLTGGTGTVAKGAKFLKFGSHSGKLFEIPDIETATKLFTHIDEILKGEKITVGRKVFEFGKRDHEGFQNLIKGGDSGKRTGVGLSAGKIAQQQKVIMGQLTKQLNHAIDTKYAELGSELRDVARAIRTANKPEIIEQSYINLANKAASLNINKDIADTVENLIRHGEDWKNVPQPTPRFIPDDWQVAAKEGEVVDEAAQAAVSTATTANRMSRLKYAESWAVKHAANAVKKLPKAAKGAKSRVTRAPVAKKVMTYTSYMGMTSKQVVRDTLDLVKANNPEILKALDEYATYLAAHGDDGTKALTMEDLATSVALQGNKYIAPELQRLMDLFDIGKVNSRNNQLADMFRAMGYSDEQTFRALSKYRAALAEDIIGNGKNFYSAKTRLADIPLDFSAVKAAREGNAKLIGQAVRIVEKERGVIARNIAEQMAAASLELAAKSGTKGSLEVRIMGIPVIHMQSPETINRAWNAFLKGDNKISESLRTFHEAGRTRFKGYSRLDGMLNSARLKTIGAGEAIIHSILGEVNNVWGGLTKNEHKLVMDHWVGEITPEILEKYGPQLAQLDETFGALKEFAPGIVRTAVGDSVTSSQIAERLNKYLPGGIQLNVEVMNKIAATGKYEFLSPDFFKAYYADRVRDLSRGSKLKTAGVSGLEHVWQLRMAMEKAISETRLYETIEKTWGLSAKSVDTSTAAGKILGTGADRWRAMPNRVDTFFKDDVLFPAELRGQIEDLMSMVSRRDTMEIGMGKWSRGTTVWKAMVTVWNMPEYFIRNGISDSIMMFFAGVAPSSVAKGARTLIDTRKYNHLLRNNPEFVRAFTAADPNNPAAMREALALADGLMDPMASRHSAIKFGNGFVREDGSRVGGLSSALALKYYIDNGLETNFVRTSLNAVRGRFSAVGKYAGDPIREINSLGEDARRITMFLDGLRLAEKRGIKNWDEALQFSSERTRKYLFDYSDFSNFERNAIGAVIPFYKWTRKAVPLMIEMMIFKPGKSTIIPKIQAGVSANNGQMPDGVNNPIIPSADLIIPSWMRTQGMMYLGDNVDPEGSQYGTYGGIPNPQAQIFDQILNPIFNPGEANTDPTANLGEQAQSYGAGALNAGLNMVNPGIKAPFDLASGSTSFGSNELGQRPVNSWADYLAGMSPQIRKVQDLREDIPNSPSEILNSLGAMSVQKNTSARQLSELFKLLQIYGPASKRATNNMYEKQGNPGPYTE